MTRARRITRRTWLGLLTLATIAAAQPAPTTTGPAEEPAAPKRDLMAMPAYRIYVHGIAKLPKPAIGVDSVDWSDVNNSLLVGKLGLTRHYSIYTMTPEGYLATPRAHNMQNSSRIHSGGPIWHPSGDFFAFTSQKPQIPHHTRSVPSVGWHCDLWLANSEGTNFWQLTNDTSSRNAPRGVTCPHFSSDGTRLVWSGTTGKANRSPWWQRSLYVADFRQNDGKPSVENIRAFQPGENRDFYEAYGFSSDDNRILFAANVLRGNPWFDLDICVFDRRKQGMINLTKSPSIWDRYATYSPNGKKIVWTSSHGMAIPYLGHRGENWQRYMRSELWIMDANGGHAKQLTFFNTKGHPHYENRRVFLGDSAFSPDGRHLAVVMYKEKHNFEPESQIVMLTLGEGRPTVVKKDAAKVAPTPRKTVRRPVPKPPKPKEKDDEKKPGTVNW